METAPATSPARPAVKIGPRSEVAPATPTTRPATDTIPSLAPSTAARSQFSRPAELSACGSARSAEGCSGASDVMGRVLPAGGAATLSGRPDPARRQQRRNVRPAHFADERTPEQRWPRGPGDRQGPGRVRLRLRGARRRWPRSSRSSRAARTRQMSLTQALTFTPAGEHTSYVDTFGNTLLAAPGAGRPVLAALRRDVRGAARPGRHRPGAREVPVGDAAVRRAALPDAEPVLRLRRARRRGLVSRFGSAARRAGAASRRS